MWVSTTRRSGTPGSTMTGSGAGSGSGSGAGSGAGSGWVITTRSTGSGAPRRGNQLATDGNRDGNAIRTRRQAILKIARIAIIMRILRLPTRMSSAAITTAPIILLFVRNPPQLQ
ncbi:MAG: hypothetical protein EA404_01180 [Spirochaetaceae bacterium]|nr:MAG: hypothetical protein EA404_01180 [Spirochaetaceae bacterium]